VPHRYNEEADERAKIASGRITVPPNVFARDVTQPSVVFEPHPSSHNEPSGAPSNPAGAEPMDEDPSNEAYVLSLLEGYGSHEADVLDIEPAPIKADWRDKYMNDHNAHNIDMLLQSSYVPIVHSSATLVLYDFSYYFDDSMLLKLASLLVLWELQLWLSLCYEGVTCWSASVFVRLELA
jgi:hypothetical protein